MSFLFPLSHLFGQIPPPPTENSQSDCSKQSQTEASHCEQEGSSQCENLQLENGMSNCGESKKSEESKEETPQVDNAGEKKEKANQTECDDEKKKKDTETDNGEEKKKDTEADKTEDKKEEKPPKIGNFALPTSQQPAALFGFGGNIIDKGEVQLYFFADDFVGKNKTVIDLIPSVLFGITDDWSVYFNFPFTPLLQDGCFKSSGLEDFFIQLEYAFYNKSTSTYVDQATLVANITVPTGSSNKIPPTGFGAPSLFLGATYYHMLVDWFVFAAPGAVLTGSNHGTKFGDQFLYQFGIGRNIPSPTGWIYAWMVEVDGQYTKKNRIRGVLDPNSGGNVIYVTPSLWVSSKEFILQFGVSYPINQNLFGIQRKFDYALNLNVAWSFY